jgi:transcription antitermination factor NusG
MKRIRKSIHVASVIEVNDQDKFVREITYIQRILDEKMSVKVHKWMLPGERVRVFSGPLQGVEGIIRRVRRKFRLAVAVEIFGQSVSVMMDKTNLIPI